MELDQCHQELDSQEAATSLISCNDEFRAVIECYDANMVCKDREVDVSACEAKEEALSQCIFDCQISSCSPAPSDAPDPG